MTESIDVYCTTCFAMPGEPCVTKYIVHGDNNLTPVICMTHAGRTIDSDRETLNKVKAEGLKESLSHNPLMLTDGAQ